VAGQVTGGKATHLGVVMVQLPFVQVAPVRQLGRGSVPYSQVSPSVQGHPAICDTSAGQGAKRAVQGPSAALETPAA
jgi:hypothetical protein